MSIHKFTLTGLACTLGLLAFSAAPALAAAPETPETDHATGETTSSATLHGVLNPGATAKGEPGSYQFSYAPSATECGAPGTLDPSSPAFATGAAKEAVSVTVTGLEPNREYAFCLVAYSLVGVTEPSYGAAVPFKTHALPPEYTASSEKASGIDATGATLEANLNPNNEETDYTFEYSEKENAGELEGTIVKVSGVLPAEFGERTASASTGVLLADKTYYYRVVGENEQSKMESKKVAGSVESFTTAPEAPETIKPAASITATTATLEGVVNPKVGATAGWYFAYSNPGGASCLEGPTTEPHETEAARDKAHVSKEVTGLQPGKKYTFCLVATDAAEAHTTAGNEVTFETKLAPPTIEPGSETTSGVTPYEATLEAQVNPNNEVTTYSFEYAGSAAEIGQAGAVTLTGDRALGGYGAQTASVSTGHVLIPGKTYYYRAIARNATGTITDPTIEHFTTPATVAPAIESESGSVQSPFAAKLEATINPEYQASTCVFEYGTVEAKVAAGEGTPVPCNPASLGEGGGGVGATASLTGLSSATKYYFRVSATNGSGTTTDTTIEKLETPIAEAPVFDSERSLFVTAFTAELEAVITPNFQTTTCELQYGTEKAKVATGGGTVVPCAPAQFGPTGKNENTDISLTGLQQGTTYYYRVVATNATGTTVAPTIAEFATPLAPAVTPGEVQSVTSSTAIFTGGSVNPDGAETRYRIAYVAAAEYEPGATNPYAKGRSTPEVNASAELTPQAVASAQVSELASGTTYHYAIIATSPAGTTIGADQTFTTGPAPAEPLSTTEPIPTTAPQLPASPFTSTPAPAFIPYTSIAALDATEAHENKVTGTTKKTKKSKKKKKSKKGKHASRVKKQRK
jgi:hypothetical protein